MVIQAFAFYLFAGILVLSALMVIMARNPVYSVLFLILAFFNASGLFIMLGAEFIAIIQIVIYVGAVAVLFLFVIMMLDIDYASLRKDAFNYVPIGLITGGILLFELTTVYIYWRAAPEVQINIAVNNQILSDRNIDNTKALGLFIYTNYVFAFQISGLILLVAMIGAIVLTHRKRPDIRKQSIRKQHARKASDVLEIKKVTSGTGI